MAIDADRAAILQAQDDLVDAEYRQEVSAREEELEVLRFKRDKSSKAILDLEPLQAYDRQRSQLVATLTTDRRKEDALVEAARKAKQREKDLRERAERSPRASGADGRATSASSTSTASPRTYAAAASSHPVTNFSSARKGPVNFESGDFRFTPGETG